MRRSLYPLIALALPVCFLMAFATCVTLCEEHTAESSVELLEVTTFFNSDESDCCPLVTSDRALLAERSKLKSHGTDVDINEAIVSNQRLMVFCVQSLPVQAYLHFSPKSPPQLRI